MTAKIKVIKVKGVYSLHNLYLKLYHHYIPLRLNRQLFFIYSSYRNFLYPL